ncbi:hypothetical protein ACM6Q7_06845 [Peribacillus butanolivorans]|uniref:hypothetical protein n=1 Tax=Peribacillus butanolivorans TaxID=421767 RepID=UPI0039FD1B04
MYRDYIKNIDRYKDIDLLNNGGLLVFYFGDGNSFITYGKSIASTITSTIVRLEKNGRTNKQMQKAYDECGDSKVVIEILEIDNDIKNLKQYSKDYIQKLNPSLNYQRTGVKEDGSKFIKEHRKHLSEAKIGEKHNRAKLTEEQAIEIKKLALYSNLTSAQIASMFNISAQQVRKIKTGRAWSHLII